MYRAERLKNFEDANPWAPLVQLVQEYKAVDLGMGTPNFSPPSYVTDALAKAATGPNVMLNQYTRCYGHPRLVKALATMYGHLLNRTIDPLKEILVTVGGYQAIYHALMSLVDPGDEVIIIEPYFGCYNRMTLLAGGKPVFVPMKLVMNSWVLDPEQLESKFSKKTKLIVVNTPHNPTGKVFSKAELEMIAKLCVKYDVIALMDEVYEWLVYGDAAHVRMASLPGMWDRTITIGSAGKSFSATGWKLGWAYGSSDLIRGMQILHENSVHSCPTPAQEAVAVALETEFERLERDDSYWQQLQNNMAAKRDKMASILTRIGWSAVVPQGGYFIFADASILANNVDVSSESGSEGLKFAKWLTKAKKFSVVPASFFYSSENLHLAKYFVRICFAKDDATLDEAEKILKTLKNGPIPV